MPRADCIFLIQPTHGSRARKKPWAGEVHGGGRQLPRSGITDWRQCSGSQLAESLHRELLVETFRNWWITALPSMTGTSCFPSFYRWKIKLLYLFLRLLFQISPRNHNCDALNVFLIVLSHNNARSENGRRILWPFSLPGPLGSAAKKKAARKSDSTAWQCSALTLPNQLKPSWKRSNGKSYLTRRILQILRRPIITCFGRWHMVWLISSSAHMKTSKNGWYWSLRRLKPKLVTNCETNY